MMAKRNNLNNKIEKKVNTFVLNYFIIWIRSSSNLLTKITSIILYNFYYKSR